MRLLKEGSRCCYEMQAFNTANKWTPVRFSYSTVLMWLCGLVWLERWCVKINLHRIRSLKSVQGHLKTKLITGDLLWIVGIVWKFGKISRNFSGVYYFSQDGYEALNVDKTRLFCNLYQNVPIVLRIRKTLSLIDIHLARATSKIKQQQWLESANTIRRWR